MCIFNYRCVEKDIVESVPRECLIESFGQRLPPGNARLVDEKPGALFGGTGTCAELFWGRHGCGRVRRLHSG